MKKAQTPLTPLFILSLLVFLSPSLSSRGTAERDSMYHREIEASFPFILDEMAAGRMTGAEGKARLSEIRRNFNRSYTDFEGMADALIDALEEGRIDRDEALSRFEERVRQRTQIAAGTDGAEGPAPSGSPSEDASPGGTSDGSGHGGNSGVSGEGSQGKNGPAGGK